MASSDVMKGIETRVILSLYESRILPCLLNNAESWTLSVGDEKKLDAIGIKVMKRLFGLPTTSPNASIIYSFGLLYITQAIDKKRFLYLHKLLNREESKWTRKRFFTLHELDIGWANNMMRKLTEYGLESNLATVQNFTHNEWKEKVRVAILKKNGRKLLENCAKTNGDDVKILTKTRHVHNALTTDKYNNEPLKCFSLTDKQKARTIFLSQNGMLECGKNMKGTIPEVCRVCMVPDDESHRLNYCIKWTDRNDNGAVIDFSDIFSNDADTVDKIVNEIEQVWETRYANGRMKKNL